MRAPVDVTGYAAPVRAVMRTARLLALSLVALAAQPAAAEDPAAARQNMVREIESQARSVRPLLGERAGIDAKVLKAMERVRRHLFVPPAQRRHAYENRPLPIGFGQTISQPYIVALMTDLLGLEPGQKVLEIGTGSGYQAAVLAVLGAEVYSIEIISELGAIAAERFDRLGHRVTTKLADGYFGWPDQAPFDAIIVTAAASHVPPPLVQQLKPGGKMVIPVGGRFLTQYLMLIDKLDAQQVRLWQLLPVRFVPLTGGH